MTTKSSAKLQISFGSPGRERKAQQFAAQLWESSQGFDAVQRQRHATPLCKAGPSEHHLNVQRLKILTEAATWLSEEANPGAADWKAILALLFLSPDSRVSLVRLHCICVQTLLNKMRTADNSRGFGDEEYYYFKLLETLTELLSGLFHAKDVHLQIAFHLTASEAVKLGMLQVCSELLAATPKAVQPKMRRWEAELVLTAYRLPLQLASVRLGRLFQPGHSKPLLNLLEALASSNFMECSARALMLALDMLKCPRATVRAGAEPSGSGIADKQLRGAILDSFTAMYGAVILIRDCSIHPYVRAEPRMLVAIKASLSGPCLQYALAGSIVSTLALTDGGTMYGMTTSLPLTREVMPDLVESWYWLCEQSPPIKLLLYSPRAVRRVCLRMLNVARLSAVSNAAVEGVVLKGCLQQPQPNQTSSSPSLPQPLSSSTSRRLALAALRCYAYMCPHPLVQHARPGGGYWTGPSTTTYSPAAAAAAAEYWSEAVNTLNTFLGYIQAGTKTDLTKLCFPDMLAPLEVAVGDWVDGEPMPPRSTSLTAALAAGYVPLLERSLRVLATADTSQKPPNHRVAPLLAVFSDHPLMASLVSYGDPHEVASLLTTGAKLLKRLLHLETGEQVRVLEVLTMDWVWMFVSADVVGSYTGLMPGSGGPSGSTSQQRAGGVDASDTATGKSCGGSASGPAGMAKKSCPSHVPSLMITCLQLWLPQLAALAQLPVTDAVSQERSVLASVKCLVWIPFMVAAMEIEEGRLQPACWKSSARYGNSFTKGHGFGWRRFLLQQLDVVGHLGLCLRMLGMCNSQQGGLMLKTACSALACLVSVLPVEVAAGLKDGRLPILAAKPFPGAAGPQRAGADKWQVVLSQLLKLKKAKDKEITVKESVVQGFWAGDPIYVKAGSMLMRANYPAATVAPFEGAAASTSRGHIHGQPPPLQLCANPGCDNLAGDSEATLPLKACGGCGAVWYCRRECQAAHWRAGHKAECGTVRAQQPHRPVGS